MKKVLKYIIIALLISIFSEIFIFNYNHFISKTYKQINDYKVSSSGYSFTYDSIRKTYNYMINVEITNINDKVNNIYIDLNKKANINVSVSLTDEANKLYYEAGDHLIAGNYNNSKYFKVHTSGNSEKIKLALCSDTEFNTDDVTVKLNENVPFYFNFLRFIILFLCIICPLIIKKYHLFDDNFSEYKYRYVILGIIFMLTMGSHVFISYSRYGNVNSDALKVPYRNHYQLLARSLKGGKLDVNLDVNEKLLKLDNPYDTKYRNSILKIDEEYYFDYAYYNGKYYVYFGVVPALLLHLPHLLITGKDLSNVNAMTMGLLAFYISAFFFVYMLFKKYFQKMKFKWYLLCTLSLALFSGISYIIANGGFYGLPNLFACAFSMLGLGFYIKATLKDKLCKKDLFIASMFMTLVVGSRPHIILSGLLLIPIYLKYIKNKELLKVKNLLAFLLPYIIIGTLLMIYNALRFSSPFDFGATYNLTTNDMTKRGFVLGRLGLGIFSYLFSIPHINNVFPFINDYEIASNYIGNTIFENMMGGFLFINLFAILNLFIFKFKKLFKDKSLYYVCLMCIISSLLIIIIDTSYAGILPRYISDYGFILTISSIIIIASILNNYKGNTKLIKKIIGYTFLIAFIINFLIFFTDKHDTYLYLKIFNYFYYTFSFWL